MNIKALKENVAVQLATETFDNWSEDKCLRLAAALAYYSIFSIAPLLVIAVSIAGLVFGVEAVQGQLDEQLRSVIGAESAKTVQSMVQSVAKPKESWIGAVSGFAVLMLGASGVFGQLKDALNTVWEVKVKKGTGAMSFLRRRLLNFGMVLVIGFLLLTSFLLTTVIAVLNKYVGSFLGLPEAVWAILAFVVAFAMTTALFALIFKILPDAKVAWCNVGIGAVVTALLFELGKFGLSYYLARESTSSSYGAAASVVLLLLWVYYASCILLFGAEFTQVYARATGHVIQPSANAELITAEQRIQEGLAPPSKTTHAIPTKIIMVPALEKGSVRAPVGAVVMTTAVSFLVGLALRKFEGKRKAS